MQSCLSYWSPASYPRTKLRQPYRMPIRTIVLTESSGGGSPPAAPTLAIADNHDGTGATAAIAGSTPGSTNAVYVAAALGLAGSAPGTLTGTRSGDGSLALGLENGLYAAWCVSTLAGQTAASNPFFFAVTGGAVALAPTGPIALPKSFVRDMLANSPTFQTRCGTFNASATYSKIFRTFVRREDDEHRSLRPYATVLTTPQVQYVLDSGGDKNYLLPEGTVGLLLLDNDRYETDIDASSTDFENFVGGVLVDLEAQAAISGGLAVIGLELLSIRRLPEDVERMQGCWWEALLGVRWQA
jgi:hypothetical protein